MVRGSPRMCIRQTGTLRSAAASSAPSPRNAQTSLIMAAPAATAARMTSALLVSTEIGTSVTDLTASITGIIRSISSCPETLWAPGRVDSPPISIIAAPPSAIVAAWRNAILRLSKLPPSENESGVTFRMPMTMGSGKLSEPRFSIVVGI